MRQQLEQLQHYTGQLARDTAGQLKQIGDIQVNALKQNHRKLSNFIFLTHKLKSKVFHEMMQNLSFAVQGLDAKEKMQKERLQDDFTRALNSFQRLQTEAAQKAKADLAAAR